MTPQEQCYIREPCQLHSSLESELFKVLAFRPSTKELLTRSNWILRILATCQISTSRFLHCEPPLVIIETQRHGQEIFGKTHKAQARLPRGWARIPTILAIRLCTEITQKLDPVTGAQRRKRIPPGLAPAVPRINGTSHKPHGIPPRVSPMGSEPEDLLSGWTPELQVLWGSSGGFMMSQWGLYWRLVIGNNGSQKSESCLLVAVAVQEYRRCPNRLATNGLATRSSLAGYIVNYNN